MSAICGIVNFDGAPIDHGLLERMAKAAAHRGPNGTRYWTGVNVGFAHLALNTTPESLREKQPQASQREEIVLTADIRVDNREELIRTLTGKEYLREKEPTDADLLLAAYAAWRSDCPQHIVGDFAFAIWDSREQQLFCARDAIGLRPFFFCREGSTFLFATAISSLLAGLSECPPLNELLLVDFLCWRFDRWGQETVYQSISRLPGAHSLIARQEGDHLTRYWMFGADQDPQYKTDAEYIEHFRHLFEETVRCRLRSATPVGIMVSGGLDSSSVACMANHISSGQSKDIQGNARLYSWAFKDFPAADERVYLEAVLETCQHFPATVFDGENLWGFKDPHGSGSIHLDEPEIFPLTDMLVTPLREARHQGCRVMLTGEGGDQVMNAAAYWRPELLLDVGLRQIGSEFGHFWKRNRWSTIRVPIQDSIIPFVKSLLRPFVKPLVNSDLVQRQRLSQRVSSAPRWVNREWVELADRAKIESPTQTMIPLPRRSATMIRMQLTGGWYVALLSYLDSISASEGVEYRMPYLDRRLIDFQLVIPPRLRFAGGMTKVILREALAGILAEQVRQRTTFAHFSEVTDYGAREKERTRIKDLLEGVVVSQNEYLDTDKVALAWQEYYDGGNLPTRPFLAPIFLEKWLRSLPAECRSSLKHAKEERDERQRPH